MMILMMMMMVISATDIDEEFECFDEGKIKACDVLRSDVEQCVLGALFTHTHTPSRLVGRTDCASNAEVSRPIVARNYCRHSNIHWMRCVAAPYTYKNYCTRNHAITDSVGIFTAQSCISAFPTNQNNRLLLRIVS